ncbi:MAG: hypothetical protein U9Q74_06010, partial [Gemmatimonadota bacterium]|nr:hypothetical protein [Gemmatimonadota bacterium]
NPALPFHAGLGIVGTLRRRRRGMRIVVVGNSANAGYRDRALRAGAEAYVDQSADLERLLELLPPVARRPGPRGDPS